MNYVRAVYGHIITTVLYLAGRISEAEYWKRLNRDRARIGREPAGGRHSR